MQVSFECCNCNAMSKSRRREFSDQVWAILIAWGEVNEDIVDRPICEDCYTELRDILIDRATEYEAALADPSSLQRPEPIVVAKTKATAAKESKSTKTAKPVAKAAKAKATGRRGVRKVSKMAS